MSHGSVGDQGHDNVAQSTGTDSIQWDDIDILFPNPDEDRGTEVTARWVDNLQQRTSLHILSDIGNMRCGLRVPDQSVLVPPASLEHAGIFTGRCGSNHLKTKRTTPRSTRYIHAPLELGLHVIEPSARAVLGSGRFLPECVPPSPLTELAFLGRLECMRMFKRMQVVGGYLHPQFHLIKLLSCLSTVSLIYLLAPSHRPTEESRNLC